MREEGKEEDVVMAEPVPAQVHREEVGRKYDPDAVFTLDLNSDSDDDWAGWVTYIWIRDGIIADMRKAADDVKYVVMIHDVKVWMTM
jgi:hypothetical protein